ncbi:MAG: cytochrome o ubiquinol oxidase subunit [Gammaproteobacteria bacterium]|nr:cytochrome o ubiquinol oxidase subunit [Gammaproteobacteria bacterium]
MAALLRKYPVMTPIKLGRLPCPAWTCALACLALASCSEGPLDPQGPVGKAERLILLDATAIMLAVIVPVIVLIFGFAWWFRSGNSRARYRPDWEYSGRIEMITWSIPALIILFLGGMAWISSHDLDPPAPLKSSAAALEVEVVSVDWRWIFIYPKQGIASVDRLTVPAGVPIHFRLTSTSVMNSFFIPQLGTQIYTMPGMTTQLNLLADHPGSYSGLSAQFSGEGFSDMRFEVVAVAAAAFQSWVDTTHAAGGVLDRPTFEQLARPATEHAVRTYGEVTTGLFNSIVSAHVGMTHTAAQE